MTSVHQHLQDCLADLTDALTILHRLLPRATTLRRLEDKGDKGCASCRRIVGPDGKTPWFNDTEKGQRTLCHWCRRITAGRRAEWVKENPGKPVPSDTRRFWPPTGALERYRDTGRVSAGSTQWDAWDRADRPKKKGRKAS